MNFKKILPFAAIAMLAAPLSGMAMTESTCQSDLNQQIIANSSYCASERANLISEGCKTSWLSACTTTPLL